MKTLGCAMIMKDEEEMLPRCLKSIEGLDQIVILDTGSTDSSVEIAKTFTKDVFTHYTWNANFAEARNEALKFLKTDWALVIDCDEVLDNGGVSKIKNFLNSGSAYKYDAISLPVITMAEDGDQVRVHKVCPEIYWDRPAHNILVHDHAKEYKLNVKIYSDYSPSHFKNPARTIEILQDSIIKNPADLRNYYYMARELMFKGDIGGAAIYFMEYIAHCPQELTSNELADVYYSLAECYLKYGVLAKAAYMAGNALVAYPHYKPAAQMLINVNSDQHRKAPWQALERVADNKDAIFQRKLKIV